MEFNEKLQALRKSKGLTQEELAEAIFVSRTAVSKWESGRGYPGIDSLKALSRFFNVTIDELICPDELITAAENEKQDMISRYTALLCGISDIFAVLLLFIPVFGSGGEHPETVSLFAVAGIQLWIKIVYAVVIGLTALNGVSGVIISRLDRPIWNRHRLVTGIALSIIACVIFIAAKQPYAGLICFAILISKGYLILRSRSNGK